LTRLSPSSTASSRPGASGSTAARYRAHTESVEALGLLAVASAHGPVLTGSAIPDAFERVRTMAGEPIVPPPGQPLLDQLLAAALAEMAVPA
jgi:hypothetical protein